MKFCQRHWDMLREEVRAQGLGDLISGNGEIAAMKTVSELNGDPDSLDNFDPLMRCYWMITNRVLEMAGLVAMSEDFGCPICVFNEHRTEDGRCKCTNPGCQAKEPGSVPDHETWLVGPTSCVTSVREMCVKRGWISA